MDQYLFDSLVEDKTLVYDEDEQVYMFTTTFVIGVITTNDGQMVILESIDVEDEGESYFGVDYNGKRYDLDQVDFSMYSMGIFDKKDRKK